MVSAKSSHCNFWMNFQCFSDKPGFCPYIEHRINVSSNLTRSSVGPDPSQFHRPHSWCSHMKRALWERDLFTVSRSDSGTGTSPTHPNSVMTTLSFRTVHNKILQDYGAYTLIADNLHRK
jgi:hypothetical protein